jgi:uncharacterized protein (DUF433 family)
MGDMHWEDHITADPGIMTGKPVVKGTRLTVDFILDLMAGGTSEADILRNYPRLTVDAIHACLAYASEAVQLARDVPIRAHA